LGFELVTGNTTKGGLECQSGEEENCELGHV
jgi:hypothetical protein